MCCTCISQAISNAYEATQILHLPFIIALNSLCFVFIKLTRATFNDIVLVWSLSWFSFFTIHSQRKIKPPNHGLRLSLWTTLPLSIALSVLISPESIFVPSRTLTQKSLDSALASSALAFPTSSLRPAKSTLVSTASTSSAACSDSSSRPKWTYTHTWSVTWSARLMIMFSLALVLSLLSPLLSKPSSKCRREIQEGDRTRRDKI